MKSALLLPAALTSTITVGLMVCPGFAHAQQSNPSQSVDPSTTSPTPDQLITPNQTATPLKPGDRLQLTIAGFPDLSGEQVVMADGMIQVPMAGQIGVGGLTPAQATATLTEALLPYVRRPQVSLSLLELSPIRISVTGEVLRPGPRLLTPSDPQNQNVTAEGQDSSPTTLSDALTLAGGITPHADLQNIVIRRVIPSNTAAPSSEGEARTEVQVNLWQVIRDGELAADPHIYDGDEIVVPTAQISSADQQASLNSTIAPASITVQVAGEVQTPGQIEVAPAQGVSEAVAAAGGPTDDAELDSVELYRMSSEGRLERQTYEFGEASAPLMNGDLIVVGKTSTGGVLDFLGRLIPPISPLLYLIQ